MKKTRLGSCQNYVKNSVIKVICFDYHYLIRLLIPAQSRIENPPFAAFCLGDPENTDDSTCFENKSTNIGSWPISVKPKTKSEIKWLSYPDDHKEIYDWVIAVVERKYQDENDRKSLKNHLSAVFDSVALIYESVKRDRSEILRYWQNYFISNNLKCKIVNFEETYYMNKFKITDYDPDFQESLEEFSCLFPERIKWRIDEAIETFKESESKSKCITKLLKRAPEVFQFINIALIFDHTMYVSWDISGFYQHLQSLFESMPIDSDEQDQSSRDYKEFLARSMKFIRALNRYFAFLQR